MELSHQKGLTSAHISFIALHCIAFQYIKQTNKQTQFPRQVKTSSYSQLFYPGFNCTLMHIAVDFELPICNCLVYVVFLFDILLYMLLLKLCFLEVF